jgi:glycosyltransferase involved in cell wall biosynthesis
LDSSVQAVHKVVSEKLMEPAPVVVAVGHGGFMREELEYVRGLGLESRFRFLPFVPDIGPTIRGCDVVVMPSLWEACPLLAMEVLCAGVPLTGSTCIGLREVLHGSPAQVVPPGDAEAIKHALLAFAGDREAIARRASDFAATARLRYDVGHTSHLLKERLELLADRG